MVLKFFLLHTAVVSINVKFKYSVYLSQITIYLIAAVFSFSDFRHTVIFPIKENTSSVTFLFLQSTQYLK